MQPPKFLDDERIYARPVNRGYMLCHGSLNVRQCIERRICDEFTDGLLDEIAPC
jgi:hypothetical protein